MQSWREVRRVEGTKRKPIWLECNEQWGRVAWDEPGEIGWATASQAVEVRRLDFILGTNKSYLKVLSGNITSFDLHVKLKEKSL